jgi:hypothetical protein
MVMAAVCRGAVSLPMMRQRMTSGRLAYHSAMINHSIKVE